VALAPRAEAWSLDTHRWVAGRAVDLAAGGCPRLVAGHRLALVERAVEPDTVLRPRLGGAEEVRHFLHLDAYGPPPFEALPRDYRAAVARFGATVVRERGLLPWHVGRLAQRLRRELGRGDLGAARETAGHLAHYVADATMPLHATRNYDGQRTHQRGLHARIEAKLVDRRLERYAQRARRIPRRTPISPEASEQALFAVLEQSYAASQSVLAADRLARQATRVGSSFYYRRLDAELGTLLADQLGTAAALTAALWEGACAPAPARASRR